MPAVDFVQPINQSHIVFGNGPHLNCNHCHRVVANYTRDRDGLITCANCERGGSG